MTIERHLTEQLNTLIDLSPKKGVAFEGLLRNVYWGAALVTVEALAAALNDPASKNKPFTDLLAEVVRGNDNDPVVGRKLSATGE